MRQPSKHIERDLRKQATPARSASHVRRWASERYSAPGFPRIDKGEGLIRTYDLLEALQNDIKVSYATLEREKLSQYLRRCVVRAVFSYIEALIECIKVELRSAIRTGAYTAALTDKETDTLGPLAIIGSAPGKFLPLNQNIKRTFRLATKIWSLRNFRLSTGGTDFQAFLTAKSARNRLTHPRTFYDIEVTDDDMHCHSVAGIWARSEFNRLFESRVQSIADSLPEDDRTILLNHIKMGRTKVRADV